MSLDGQYFCAGQAQPLLSAQPAHRALRRPRRTSVGCQAGRCQPFQRSTNPAKARAGQDSIGLFTVYAFKRSQTEPPFVNDPAGSK